MATLNTLIGFMYDLVQSTWLAASVLMKYFLAGVILRSIQLEDLSIESLGDRTLEYGKYIVIGTGLIGLVITLTNINLQPVLLFPSQLIAVGVLGYLFWKY